jgi:glycosyltransferase involved in cell wall biosynthesis
MRIALISEHASPLAAIGGVDAGGQNVHVAALATALAARGHEIVVYTRRDDPGLPERVELCPGVAVEHLRGGPPIPVAKDDLPQHLDEMTADLLARLPGQAPDVVHAHFWMSGRIGSAAMRRLGLPLVQTFHALGGVKRRHQGAADTSPPERIGIEAELARTATRLTASCSDEARELLTMGASRRRIDIVPSGVDLTRFAPTARPPTRSRLLTIGRLVPRKGVDDVIRALAELPGMELVIAGGPPAEQLPDDPEAGRLRELIRRLGLDDRVVWCGPVPHDELPDLISSAHAVVCAPHYEPFGIVPLEAMACGVPVIGTAVGGLLDTVVDGITGYLVPVRSPSALAAAVRRLDDPTRARFGAAGLARVRRYAWPRIAAATERTYLRAVMGARRMHPAGEEVVG